MSSYYKIVLKFFEAGQLATAQEYVKAETREDALAASREIAASYGVQDECGIEISKADIGEMIANEEEELMAALRREYVFAIYDAAHLSLREYNRLIRSLEGDVETEYLLLKRANKKLRIEKFVRRQLKGKRLDVDSMYETVRMLTDAADQKEFDRICRERLYGL